MDSFRHSPLLPPPPLPLPLFSFRKTRRWYSRYTVKAGGKKRGAWERETSETRFHLFDLSFYHLTICISDSRLSPSLFAGVKYNLNESFKITRYCRSLSYLRWDGKKKRIKKKKKITSNKEKSNIHIFVSFPEDTGEKLKKENLESSQRHEFHYSSGHMVSSVGGWMHGSAAAITGRSDE